MNIEIISCSKVREDFVLSGAQEYLKRFPRDFCVEVKELKNPLTKLFEREAHTALILLDETGTKCTTSDFANYIREQRDNGLKKMIFAIGPAEGWNDQQRKAADRTLSLSLLTFPYQMAQLILTEQIYRAYTIIQGIPYHK